MSRDIPSEEIQVALLADGRVEVIYAHPLSEGVETMFFYFFGSYRDSEILHNKEGKMVGVRCVPEAMIEHLTYNTPHMVEDFKNILRELRDRQTAHERK